MVYSIKALQDFGSKIERHLRPATYPFGIKMLRSIEEIPKNTKRPKKDFNTCLSLCQGFSLTRRNGLSITWLKEDMWCPIPVFGLGLAKTPKYFLNGNYHYPGNTKTLEIAAVNAGELPRFNINNYIGIVSAPLSSINFEPDVLIIYTNPAKLLQLLIAAKYGDGKDITVKLSSGAACVYAIVPAMQSNEYYVSVPCDGDHRRAGAKDDEIIFSIPIKRLDDILSGLENGPKIIPTTPNMETEYKLAPSAAKIANLMEMKKIDGTDIEGFDVRLPYE